MAQPTTGALSSMIPDKGPPPTPADVTHVGGVEVAKLKMAAPTKIQIALLAAILVVQGVLLWRLWSATAMAKSAAEDTRELKLEVIKGWPR